MQTFALVITAGFATVALGQVQVLQVPPEMEPVAISGDGNVVVGFSRASSLLSSRLWRIDSNTVVSIPSNASVGTSHKAVACSYDGSIIAGTCNASGQVAFRWVVGGAVTLITAQSGRPALSSSSAMSDDGLHIGGDSLLPPRRGALWSDGSGVRLLEAPSPELSATGVSDLSGDGQVAVGRLSGGILPYIWRADTGAFLVPVPAGMATNSNLNLTAIGDAVFGSVNELAPGTARPFTWNPDTGFTPLPNLPGYQTTLGAVNDDGRIAVGQGSNPIPSTDRFAVIHTFGTGTITLGEYVRSMGGTNPDTDFEKAFSISNDGRVILGEGGIYPYWVVILPEQSLANFNADPMLDFFDLSDYLDCFEGRGPLPPSSADLNRDGMTDFFDLIDFLDAFGG